MDEVFLVMGEDPFDAHDTPTPLRAFRDRSDAEAFRIERYEATFGKGTAGDSLRWGCQDEPAIDSYFPVRTIGLV